MRTITLVTFITLIALAAAPAFAQWTEALAPTAPVGPIEMGTEVSAPPVEVADNSTAAVVEQAHAAQAPDPVVNIQPTPAASEPIIKDEERSVQPIKLSDDSAPKPSYMVVYKTANDLKPLSMIVTFDPNNPSAVPEPGSIVALSTGIGGLLLKFRKRRK